MAKGVMDFNVFGVAFIDDDITQKQTEEINKKMEDMLDQVREDFHSWLGSQGYESIMGVIVHKGYACYGDK